MQDGMLFRLTNGPFLGTPLAVDASRRRRSFQFEFLLAGETNLPLLPDVGNVRTVIVFAQIADQKYLSVGQGAGIRTQLGQAYRHAPFPQAVSTVDVQRRRRRRVVIVLVETQGVAAVALVLGLAAVTLRVEDDFAFADPRRPFGARSRLASRKISDGPVRALGDVVRGRRGRGRCEKVAVDALEIQRLSVRYATSGQILQD